MSITSMSNRARLAENLSIPQLQQSIKDGVVPSYIGVPLLQEKVKDAKLLQAAKAAQSAMQQPSVAQQIMAQAEQVEQGVPSLPTNLPQQGMAGGGIVAFAEGGMYDEEDDYEDRVDAARSAEMEDLMNEYAQTFQGGIGQLPAATAAAPSDREGIAGGDAADFVARIMHKESRGRRYGKDGELLTSEKGAKGEMQVMPGTSRDPGFGVTPARDSSPDELARVGRDYAKTLLERYGDPKLAAIAYNMGPGATDKWLAAGADMSKLPRETQGYVKGFASGGAIHFQNRGLVDNQDFSTVEGMEPSDLYAEAIKRAKAERAQKAVEQLTDNQKRYSGLWPYNAPEAGKFSYEDAAKFDARTRENEPAVTPTSKPGITYAPNSGIGNVTPTRYVPKASNEPQSEYGRQMSEVGGFFGDVGKGIIGGIGTLGKHLVSAPGYGFSSQGRPEEKASASGSKQAPYDFAEFDAATARYMNDRDQARLAKARQDELSLREEAKAAGQPTATKATPDALAGASKGTPAAAVSDPYAEFKELFAKREANLGKQREQDKYMALLQAGLGMMGGTSQHALANIGAGAAQGIQSLAEARKAATAEENALLSGRLGLAKIGSAKEQADAMMQLRRDLAQKSDERARDLASASLDEKTRANKEREDSKTYKLLSDIEGRIRSDVAKEFEKNVQLQMKPDAEALKEQMVQDRLRAHKTYGRKYKDYYKEDPFADMGGGTGFGPVPENAVRKIKG